MRTQAVAAVVEIKRQILIPDIKGILPDRRLSDPVSYKVPAQLCLNVHSQCRLPRLTGAQTHGTMPLRAELHVRSYRVDLLLVFVGVNSLVTP